MKGKKHTPESRKQMSVSLKKSFVDGRITWNMGKKASEATRKKISLAGKGRTPFNKGKKLSEKHRRGLSIARKKLFASGYIDPRKGKKNYR